MPRFIVIAGITLLGLILLSACSDDAEPTSEQVAVPTTVSQDQASATPEPTATATVAPTPTPTAAPEPTSTATFAPTPTAAPELTATATVTPTPTPTATATVEPIPASGESVTISLDELNDSGQSGTASLTAVGESTIVDLTLSTGTLQTELVHIHAGQCGDSLGGVAHGLTNFVDGSGESVTSVDITIDSLLTGGFAVNAHQSGNPGTYTACGNIPAKGQAVSIALDELNASGQSGTVTLTAIGDTTVVELTLSTGSMETELVHIHAGQCGDTLGGVAYALTSFAGGSGASVTTVDSTLDNLLTGGFAVNAHESANPGTYTACGDIPAKGDSVTITLDELNTSGQAGAATLTAIGDTILVELSLTAGALETELVHIHVGQCGETLADVAHVLTNFVGGSGASVTALDVTLDSLLTGGFAVNAHQSGNPGVYTACGNIPGTDETSIQASVEANIQQFAHVNLTVAVGTTVQWTNFDQSTHTVTLGSNGNNAGGFDSGNLGRDATFEFTFDTAGAFAYTCTIHPSMNATITVEGEATAATGNPLYSR